MSGPPDDTPFGPDLAQAVVRVLKGRPWAGALHAIVRSHRDDTGHGLFHDAGRGGFHVSASMDGLPSGAPLIAFEDEAAFTDWLARQSDRSLSIDGQPDLFGAERYPSLQRITRAFLLAQIARPR